MGNVSSLLNSGSSSNLIHTALNVAHTMDPEPGSHVSRDQPISPALQQSPPNTLGPNLSTLRDNARPNDSLTHRSDPIARYWNEEHPYDDKNHLPQRAYRLIERLTPSDELGQKALVRFLAFYDQATGHSPRRILVRADSRTLVLSHDSKKPKNTNAVEIPVDHPTAVFLPPLDIFLPLVARQQLDQVVSWLVRQPITFDARDPDQKLTALQWANRHDNHKLKQSLHVEKLGSEDEMRSAMAQAIGSGNILLIQKVLASRIITPLTPLIKVAIQSNPSSASSAQTLHAIDLAVMHGQDHALRLLLRWHRFYQNKNAGLRPYGLAAALLTKPLCRPDSDLTSSLHQAIQRNDVEMVEVLLNANAALQLGKGCISKTRTLVLSLGRFQPQVGIRVVAEDRMTQLLWESLPSAARSDEALHNDGELLRMTAASGWVEFFEILLDATSSCLPTETSLDIFRDALAHEQLPIMKLLLERLPDAQRLDVFRDALAHEQWPIMKLLLERLPDAQRVEWLLREFQIQGQIGEKLELILHLVSWSRNGDIALRELFAMDDQTSQLNQHRLQNAVVYAYCRGNSETAAVLLDVLGPAQSSKLLRRRHIEPVRLLMNSPFGIKNLYTDDPLELAQEHNAHPVYLNLLEVAARRGALDLVELSLATLNQASLEDAQHNSNPLDEVLKEINRTSFSFNKKILHYAVQSGNRAVIERWSNLFKDPSYSLNRPLAFQILENELIIFPRLPPLLWLWHLGEQSLPIGATAPPDETQTQENKNKIAAHEEEMADKLEKQLNHILAEQRLDQDDLRVYFNRLTQDLPHIHWHLHPPLTNKKNSDPLPTPEAIEAAPQTLHAPSAAWARSTLDVNEPVAVDSEDINELLALRASISTPTPRSQHEAEYKKEKEIYLKWLNNFLKNPEFDSQAMAVQTPQDIQDLDRRVFFPKLSKMTLRYNMMRVWELSLNAQGDSSQEEVLTTLTERDEALEDLSLMCRRFDELMQKIPAHALGWQLKDCAPSLKWRYHAYLHIVLQRYQTVLEPSTSSTA